jgi:hypothetical protein
MSTISGRDAGLETGSLGRVQDATLRGSRPGTADIRRARRLIVVLLFAFYVLTLLASQGADYFLRDPDIYWHVAVGRDIWRTGAFPQLDTYSFTFQGHPWIANQWLGELLFVGAYNLAAWRGVALLTALVIALTYSFMFLILSHRMRLTVAAGIAVTAYSFSLGHFNARPQIFADPLLILWVAGLLHAVENRVSPSWLLFPVIALWANLHGSFSFGLAIAVACAVAAVFCSDAGKRRQVALGWTVFLAAALGAACITPYGYRSLLVTLQVFDGNEALSHIGEWRPVTLETPGVNEIFLFGLLFLALRSGLKLPVWRLLMVLAITYLMFAHIRFASLFGILTPILLAQPLTRQFPFFGLNAQVSTDPGFFRVMSRASHAAFFPLCTLIALGILSYGAYGPPVSPKPSITPAAAVDCIVANNLSDRRLYNDYDFGGYLIFRNIKTFIDGRTDQLFLEGFTNRFFELVRHHPRQFTPFLSEYGITLALVAPASMESQELAAASEWKKIYSDKLAELFVKRD